MFFLKALENYELLLQWAMGGGFESDLAELSLQAALDAWRKAKSSPNPKEHIKRMITHLELAGASQEKVFFKLRLLKTIASPNYHDLECSKLFCIRLMTCACHVLVDETKDAALICIEQAEDCCKRYKENDLPPKWFYVAFPVTLPAMIISAFKDDVLEDFGFKKTSAIDMDDAYTEPLLQQARELVSKRFAD